jgi:hypothetical protein
LAGLVRDFVDRWTRESARRYRYERTRRLSVAAAMLLLVAFGPGCPQTPEPSDGGVGQGVSAIADTDADGVLDTADNCLVVANADQTDSNADGQGDACECGDANGNGFIDVGDVSILQDCAVGAIACPALCDVTGDGICNSIDARLVQRVAGGTLPETALASSSRRSRPTPRPRHR